MTTQEVANRLVELLKIGDYPTIYSELFSPDVVNVEPKGTPWEPVQGLEAIAKKGKDFDAMLEAIHSSEVSDPLAADNFISLAMKTIVTWKGATEQSSLDEICVYTVKDGKIVREEFFYTPMPSPSA